MTDPEPGSRAGPILAVVVVAAIGLLAALFLVGMYFFDIRPTAPPTAPVAAPPPVPTVSRGPAGGFRWQNEGKTDPRPGIDVAHGSFAVLDHAMAFVVWTDLAKIDGGGTRGPTEGTFEGFLQTTDGRPIEWRCSIRSGKAGEFTMEGRDFKLDDGTLFLVRARQSPAVIKQMKRPDLNTLADKDGLIKILRQWAQEDAEIRAFFDPTQTP
ncbi:MAG: hypothetical protein OER86_08710 [Phycisphaerae bacterium]|nr:hypothetical protein [Phycisphaerae bacterium]